MVTTYADVRRHQTRGLRLRARRLLRNAALDVASAFTSEEALSRPRVQIIFLHHLLTDEERPFRALIERLLRQHTFIAYSEAVKRVTSGDVDRPYLSVTFDDGLRSQLRAAEILRDYAIPACFFVCESMLDAPPPEAAADFCRRELGLPPLDFLTWADLEQLKAAGHEIGNHSRSHRSLASLSAGELSHEIGGSLAALRRRLGDDVRHFAWPRGWFHDFSAAAVAEVFRAGHASCASAVRGCHVAGPPRDARGVCLRRDQVIAADPLQHTLYFLAKNSLRANDSTRDWPQW